MLTRLKPPKEAFDDQGRGLVSILEYLRHNCDQKKKSLDKSLENSNNFSLRIILCLLFSCC